MIVSNVFEHALRRRSYELVAAACDRPAAEVHGDRS
jgi:hypothetical protein